jgi:hypothetical protein
MIFILRSLAGFDGIVSRVMRARSDFVDVNIAWNILASSTVSSVSKD